jgi:hypothetical protein
LFINTKKSNLQHRPEGVNATVSLVPIIALVIEFGLDVLFFWAWGKMFGVKLPRRTIIIGSIGWAFTGLIFDKLWSQ